jgi:hypothetical protein
MTHSRLLIQEDLLDYVMALMQSETENVRIALQVLLNISHGTSEECKAMLEARLLD